MNVCPPEAHDIAEIEFTHEFIREKCTSETKLMVESSEGCILLHYRR